MTTDWIEFEGRVEPMIWGKATYRILRLPSHVTDRLRSLGAKRVEGEINEHPVNMALSRAPVVDGVFLWAGASVLDRIGIAPGEQLDIRLRPAPDDQVDTPDDVVLAIMAEGISASWEALTPGKRRGLLYQIRTAKTANTRAKRIAALADALIGRKPNAFR